MSVTTQRDFMKEKWEIKKLGEVCEIVNGKNQKKVENKNGNYPIMGSGGQMGYADDYLCPIGTIVLGRKGTINNPFIVNENVWLVDTAFGLVADNSIFNNRFLLYFCKSFDFTRLNVAVTIPSLRKIDLKKIPIPIPPLPIQEAIVKELDILHRLKELQEQQLAEYDNLAQSTFYSMFGDPIENEKGWEVRKLGDVVKPKAEIKRAKRKIQANETISYIDISSIDNSTNKITSFTEYVFSEAPSRAQQVVEVGDIVVSLVRPNLNNVAILEEEYSNSVASSGFCVLRPSTINLQFLFYIVKGDKFRAYLSARTAGANYPAVREEDIKSFDLFYPPLSLQTDFANRIEKIEAQKELVKQGIAETQLLIDYTMDKYFG